MADPSQKLPAANDNVQNYTRVTEAIELISPEIRDMGQIGTVEHVLALVELEIRTPKKALIYRLFSLNDRNFSVTITKPTRDVEA